MGDNKETSRPLDENFLNKSKDKIEHDMSESFSIDDVMRVEVTHPRSNLIGIIYMIIASVSFGFMGFFIKLTYAQNPNLAGGDILLARSVIMAPVYYTYAKVLKVDLFDISFYHVKILFLR